MTKDIEKWWDEVAKSYQKETKIPTYSAHYGPQSPDENELKLLGNIKGKRILEIGCGGGQCSIAFAKKGAKCIGIDLSREQLNFAERLAQKNKVKVKFIKESFQNLSVIKSSSQDIVFSAFALQYSPNLDKVFQEVYRVLKRKGIFVFSLDHPFYNTLSFKTLKIENSYYKTGKFIEHETWPDGSKHTFVMYKRKVSNVYNSLIKARFFVEKIIEPLKIYKDPWENKYYPKKLVKLMGPTIIFKTKK